jgi:hypothetical protein
VNKKLALGIAAMVIFACGCAMPGDYIKGTPEKNIFMYGHIKFADSKDTPDWVSLSRVLPKNPDGSFYIYGCHMYYGSFMQGNLTPGSYAFYRISKNGQPYDIGAGSDGFRLTEPGIFYAGTYEISTKGHLPGHFELDRAISPTEAEVIRDLMHLVAGTPWEEELKARLKKLEEGL